MQLSISKGNAKMGSIPSVSLPAGITCRSDCECSKKCYAKKIERLRATVRDAYQRNYDLYKSDPDTYWRELEASIMMSRFFRFHVSGDIPDDNYFENMIQIAKRNTHCEILCFTKKYDIVNEWMAVHGNLPSNLHLIFSIWRGLSCDNLFGLPEAHVKYREGDTTAADNAKVCNGNCTECALTDEGCWTLKMGEQVVFNEH